MELEQEAASAADVGRLTDRISLGVLARVIDRDMVDEVVADTGRREKRSRLLPAHVVVYFAMAMCLFFDDSYEEVMRKVVDGMKMFGSWQRRWQVPTTGGISQARVRLGPKPLEELFDRVARPCAGLGTKGAWVGGRLVVAVDGTSFDAPDTDDNVAAFDRAGAGPNASAYPKVSVVGLVECGTHAVIAARLGSCRTAETTLAAGLFADLQPGMLLLADRNFYSYTLWKQALATGADLLWRVKANLTLPVLAALPDGSYRSVLIRPRITGRQQRADLLAAAKAGADLPADDAIAVRVIEYEVPDRTGGGTGEIICLITSVLDPFDIPAVDLAAAYQERWEEENVFDEIKTHLRGAGRVLRSKKPDLVRQEIWALLLAHYAIRKIMVEAADEADLDPDRLSFLRSLRVIRRHVTSPADFSP